MTSFRINIALETEASKKDPKKRIFRTVLIPDHASFADLDSIVNSVFQWGDCCPHEFTVDGEKMARRDEDTTALADHKGQDIVYTYLMDEMCRLDLTWLEDSDKNLRGTPVLEKWRGMPPVEGFRGRVGFNRETIRNSLQTWGVQGVRPPGAAVLDPMVRMDIICLLKDPVGRPVAFSRKEKRAVFVGGGTGGVSRADIEADPDDYTYILEDPDAYYRDLADRFSRASAGRPLPLGADPYDAMDRFVRSQRTAERWINYALEDYTALVMEWASKNGFYFSSEAAEESREKDSLYDRPWMYPDYADDLAEGRIDRFRKTKLESEIEYMNIIAEDPDVYEELCRGYREKAEQGKRPYVLWMGLRSYLGIGAEEDDRDALRWFSIGEAVGDRYCRFMLAQMYRWDLPDKGPKECFDLAKRAAEQGCEEAMALVADMYLEGIGRKASAENAERWYKKALDAGYTKVNLQLGHLRRHKGVGDPEEAFGYYELAASEGSAEAMYELGMMFLEGGTVEQSYLSAVNCFMASGNYGDPRGFDMAIAVLVDDMDVPGDSPEIVRLRERCGEIATQGDRAP